MYRSETGEIRFVREADKQVLLYLLSEKLGPGLPPPLTAHAASALEMLRIMQVRVQGAFVVRNGRVMMRNEAALCYELTTLTLGFAEQLHPKVATAFLYHLLQRKFDVTPDVNQLLQAVLRPVAAGSSLLSLISQEISRSRCFGRTRQLARAVGSAALLDEPIDQLALQLRRNFPDESEPARADIPGSSQQRPPDALRPQPGEIASECPPFAGAPEQQSAERQVAVEDKLRQELQAFQALKPDLLRTHSARFVAIHHGEVIDSDVDDFRLAVRVENRATHEGPIAICRVCDEGDEGEPEYPFAHFESPLPVEFEP
ncbi:MAG: hypothetical protein ABIP48_12895 [Planctomycetota bacterium]